MNRHEKYMGAALVEAGEALAAGEFPVGCVVVLGDEIVARGHRLNSRDRVRNEIDHAEVVVLRKLLADRPGLDLSAAVFYSTMEPCLMCYATLLLNGVRTFVYGYEDAMGGGTSLDLTSLSPLYKDMEVSVVSAVLRKECLDIFKGFFQGPDNDYWQESLLARYTLEQESL